MTDGNPVTVLIGKRNAIAKRLKSDDFDAAAELRAVVELLGGMLEHHLEVDDVVTEMVDQQGSYIQPELAFQLVAVLTACGQAMAEMRDIAIGLDDDLRRKRALDMTNALEEGIEQAIFLIQDVTVEDDSEDDDDDDSGDDGDDRDDGDEAQEEEGKAEEESASAE